MPPFMDTTINATELSAKLRRAKSLLIGPLRPFIPIRQRAVLADLLRGEEREWFADKLIDLDRIIRQMPVTYQTNGQGDDAIAHLRYFGGGAFNAWITEKDVDGGTPQAYGKQDLYGDGGERGYISIDEIVQSARCEIDLHWEPKPLKECR